MLGIQQLHYTLMDAKNQRLCPCAVWQSELFCAVQHGSIRARRGKWELRYWVSELDADGNAIRRQKSKKLADVDDAHRSRKDVKDDAARFIAGVNRNTRPEASLPIREFAEQYFIPFIKARRRPTMVKFYTDLFKNHINPQIGNVRLRDFRTYHAQQVLDSASVDLKESSVRHIKTGMTACLRRAIDLGILDGGNPAREARVEGKRSATDDLPACSLEEIFAMLELLDEPAKTIVATAAFAGLREAELRGLRIEDFDGTFLHIQRSVWRCSVNQPKTAGSAGKVPVIAPLRKLLFAHIENSGRKSGWLFAGPKRGFSLNLDNLVKRNIRKTLDGRWCGWHAFRRGLATNLFHLGVPAETAQIILRHENVSTTRKHYIKLKASAEGVAAMKKLGRLVGQRWGRRNRSMKPRIAESRMNSGN